MMQGALKKLKTKFADTIQYYLELGDTSVFLNPLLGQTFSLQFSGEIECLACQKIIKKSYQQGYCFPCTQKLAQCDICVIKPERCHYHLGTCREPTWGDHHCFVPHVVYLSNTSDLKVGITRESQIPTRWMDQGATQALPIARTTSRVASGHMEVFLSRYVTDKTVWRRMLSGQADSLDLIEKKYELEAIAKRENQLFPWILDAKPVNLQYPVLEYPKKIVSLNFEKTSTIEGTLLGIKGQYLMFDTGVINIRSFSGYKITFDRKTAL